MNIGLTGGIATGKSTVSALLVAKGALLIDADAIAREVMLPGHPVLAAVIQHFGQAIVNSDGTLHRKKLGEIVFGDPAQRQALTILHILLFVRKCDCVWKHMNGNSRTSLFWQISR